MPAPQTIDTQVVIKFGGGAIVNNGDSAEVTPLTLTQRHIMRQLGYTKTGTNALWRSGTVTGVEWARVSDNLYPAISAYLTTAEAASVVSSAPIGFSLTGDIPVFQPKPRKKTIICIGDSISAGVSTTQGLLDAPIAQAIVILDPTAVENSLEPGEYLICVPGTWAGVPQPTFTYQWVRSGVPIVGATDSVYELQAADVGETLTCLVLGSNTEGSLEIETAATGVIGSATGGGFADIDDIAAVDIYMKTNDAGSITSSGGLVSAHANQIGGGTNAVQATSTLQPMTGTRTINTVNVFDFIPVDYMKISEDLSSGTEFSFGLVFQMDNFSNERAIWDQSPGRAGAGLRAQAGGSLFLFSYTDEGLIYLTDAATPLVAGTSYLVAGRFKSGFSQLWVNGGAPYATSTETFTSIVTAASDLIIGSRTEGSNVTDGVIGNYFFSTDTFLRNVEINNAMNKIATDFGLTWTPITL